MYRFAVTLFFLSALILSAGPQAVLAGWVLVDQEGTATLVQNGKIKEISEGSGGPWMIMDFKNSKVLMYNPADNSCSETSFDEYCRTVRIFGEAMQEAMKAFAGSEMEEEEPPVVKIVPAGGGKVAGLETLEYQVFVDGELYEEVWLTDNRELLNERGDMESYLDILKCFGEMGESVENDPAYLKLVGSGWVLKQVSHELGEPEVTETISLEKKDIPDSEFSLPEGCRKVDIREIMQGD